jgi:GxxExxY protein
VAEVDPNKISEATIGCAIKVHRALGPGLLESAYEACLCYELARNGVDFVRQKPLPVHYDGCTIDCSYRMDVVVADSLIVEIKAVERLASIHDAQLLTYLKLSGMQLGLLVNFNVELLHKGIRRIVHGLPERSRG